MSLLQGIGKSESSDAASRNDDCASMSLRLGDFAHDGKIACRAMSEMRASRLNCRIRCNFIMDSV